VRHARAATEARRTRDILLICATAWLLLGLGQVFSGHTAVAFLSLASAVIVGGLLGAAWAGEPRRSQVAAHTNLGISIIALVVLASMGGGTSSIALWFLAALPALIGCQFGGRRALGWHLAVVGGITIVPVLDHALLTDPELAPLAIQRWVAACMMALVLVLVSLSAQAATRRLERGFAARNAALGEVRDRLAAKDQALRNALAEAREQAIRDPLTGIFNRRWFDSALPMELERAGRDNTSLVLLIVDVDRFKRINDHFGHPTGDAALRMVSRLLGETFRRTDMVCRLGGDEFAVLLPMASPAAAVDAVGRFQAALAAARVQGAEDVEITTSLGYARFDGAPIGHPPLGQGANGAALAEGLLHLADAAMYEAKRRGGGVLVTAGELPDSALDSLTDEQQLAVIDALR